jgi:putative phosphoesterase
LVGAVPTRVGVVADTHCPEFLDRLPPRLGEVLAGVELILHAGDVGGPGGEATLAELGRIAPVIAVRGDHDAGLDLPTERVEEIAGRRVAVVHGNRSRLIEEPVTFVGTVSLGYLWPMPALARSLTGRFPGVDVIVYGHTHRAVATRAGSTLLFNPGAVYQVSRAEAERRLARDPGWFEWSWLQVIRHRRRIEPASVGILTLSDAGVAGEVIPL